MWLRCFLAALALPAAAWDAIFPQRRALGAPERGGRAAGAAAAGASGGGEQRRAGRALPAAPARWSAPPPPAPPRAAEPRSPELAVLGAVSYLVAKVCLARVAALPSPPFPKLNSSRRELHLHSLRQSRAPVFFPCKGKKEAFG